LFISRAFKVFLIAILVCVFAALGYAYATANNVPVNKAGVGAGAISTISMVSTSVQFVLNTDNPQTIDSVTFTLNGTPGDNSTIKVKLVNTGPSSIWYNCTRVATQVTCGSTASPLGAPVLSTGMSLHVVIAD
jgi:hypothetical protein